MRRVFLTITALGLVSLAAGQPASGQVLGGTAGVPGLQAEAPNPLSDTTLKPGKALLFDLETKFARATAEGGGKAFASWFAEDGATMGNGQAPQQGREAIAKSATWSPKAYQLTWTPTDAVMSPSGDMGYTWGHYEGRSLDSDGNSKVTSGRYLTIWRKEPDGSWKVLLDASQEEPASAADCCKLPPGD
ncbi:MAG TPA: nuclear transport factor 2 family protein [Acidobacteriaceae bacterium]|jgi:ketosteroid isomerase-like protein|nr:nuclear transport factor 2 family protein [Acidobacteriaceae bacterium]